MDRLIYTSLSGLRGAMHRQTVTANNLANISTTGFRREISVAQSQWITGSGGLDTRAVARQEVAAADMLAGEVNHTGRPLDIALNGDALLTVQAENGEESYTRRGDLRLSDTGLMTTGDGRPVQGDQGPVTLPPADSMRIDSDGSIWIVPTGGDPDAPQRVDRLKLVSPQGSDVVKGLDGLFRVRGGGALPADPEARLTPSSLEGSNVEATQALIDMIDASQAWDNQNKLIATARDMDAAGTELMRLPS